jgi:hypothetical protein
MLTIEYKPDDVLSAMGDGQAINFVIAELNIFRNLQELYGDTFERHTIVSNSLVIDHFRLAIKKQQIKHTDISFLFNDEILPPTEEGRLNRWPQGFCDYQARVLAGLCSRIRPNVN